LLPQETLATKTSFCELALRRLFGHASLSDWPGGPRESSPPVHPWVTESKRTKRVPLGTAERTAWYVSGTRDTHHSFVPPGIALVCRFSCPSDESLGYWRMCLRHTNPRGLCGIICCGSIFWLPPGNALLDRLCRYWEAGASRAVRSQAGAREREFSQPVGPFLDRSSSRTSRRIRRG
jgi:hypothetical protein